MSSLRIIADFIGSRWKMMAIGGVFVVVTNLLQVLVPSYVGRGVDMLRGDFVMGDIISLCGILLLIELGKSVTRFFMRYIIIGESWRVEHDIRCRLYGHLLKLPLSFYHRSRTGDIIARITNDLTAVRSMVGPAVMYSINTAVLMPLAVIFMLREDAKLAMYGIIPFPFIAVIIYFIGKRIHRSFRHAQEAYSDISAHVQENLNGIRLIKAYVREMFEIATLRRLSLGYVGHSWNVIRLQSLFNPVLDIFASAGVIIVIWIGGQRVAANETSLGSVVSLIMYIGMLVWPSIALGWVVAIFQRGMASAIRIREILDEPPERPDEGETDAPLSGALDVTGLTFAYPGSEPVLHDIHLSLASGETLAVVGRTGSGKTSLLNVLTGAYDIPRGAVSYDGIDINDIPLGRLRGSISLVPQESFLFSETVAENIAFGRDDADRETIRRAAEYAAIDKEIEHYPDTYETMLGERGLTVSGGQRQRLTIARALITEAPILFFDDCLSNVDTSTEMQILHTLKTVVKSKTAVIVTHRLGAVSDADKIVFLENGRIVEHGTHDELMRLDGEYAALYSEQESLEKLGED